MFFNAFSFLFDIKIDTFMIEREKIYIWNELHSIAAVKSKRSSISRRSTTGEWF